MCGGRFTVETVSQIACQMIDRMEILHSIGYVHRDLNMRNFMVAEEDCMLLYLIDFGLAKRYIEPDQKQHIQRTAGRKFVGTVKFSSIASHEGYGIDAESNRTVSQG
jgi:casein kinase I family protein HRR25